MQRDLYAFLKPDWYLYWKHNILLLKVTWRSRQPCEFTFVWLLPCGIREAWGWAGYNRGSLRNKYSPALGVVLGSQVPKQARTTGKFLENIIMFVCQIFALIGEKLYFKCFSEDCETRYSNCQVLRVLSQFSLTHPLFIHASRPPSSASPGRRHVCAHTVRCSLSAPQHCFLLKWWYSRDEGVWECSHGPYWMSSAWPSAAQEDDGSVTISAQCVRDRPQIFVKLKVSTLLLEALFHFESNVLERQNITKTVCVTPQ